MKTIVSFSAARWAVQVRTMIAELGVEASDFLKQELRLVLEQIIKFTPPHTKAEGGMAVRANIGQLVQPLNIETFRDKRLAAIVETHNFGAFAAFTKHVASGPLQGAVAIAAADVPALHERYRNGRGRVNPGVRLRNFVLGRADVKELKEYIKRKVGNVGMAKAGWFPGLIGVGGAMAAVDGPNWAGRHGYELGKFVSNLDNPDKPSVLAINTTPWAARRDEGARIIRSAQDSRVNAMKGRLKFLVKYVGERAGLRAA